MGCVFVLLLLCTLIGHSPIISLENLQGDIYCHVLAQFSVIYTVILNVHICSRSNSE